MMDDLSITNVVNCPMCAARAGEPCVGLETGTHLERKAASNHHIEQLKKELVQLEMVRVALIKPFTRRYNTVVATLGDAGVIEQPFQHDTVAAKITMRKGRWVDFTPYEVKATRIIEGTHDKNNLTIKEANDNGLTVSTPELEPSKLLVVLNTAILRANED